MRKIEICCNKEMNQIKVFLQGADAAFDINFTGSLPLPYKLCPAPLLDVTWVFDLRHQQLCRQIELSPSAAAWRPLSLCDFDFCASLGLIPPTLEAQKKQTTNQKLGKICRCL